MKNQVLSVVIVVSGLIVGACHNEVPIAVEETGEFARGDFEQTGKPRTESKAVESSESFNFTYDVQSAAEKQEGRTRLLLVFDDSPSMDPFIKSMSESVPELVDALVSAGIDYEASIFMMSDFARAVVDLPDGSAGVPGLLSESTMFDSVAVFNASVGSTPFAAKLQDISDNPVLYNNEAGACTLAHYLEDNVGSFRPDDRIAAVFLSDEANSRTFEIRSAVDDSLESSRELKCAMRRDVKANSYDRKFDRLISGTRHNYKFKTERDQWKYTGKYWKDGTCQNLGFATRSEQMDLVKLYTTQRCVKETTFYTCQESQTIYKWVADGYETSTNMDNMKRCQIADKVECDVVSDGQVFPTLYARNVGASMQRKGYTCREDQNSSLTWKNIPNSDNAVGVRPGCFPFSKEENGMRLVTKSDIPETQIGNYQNCSNPKVVKNYQNAFSVQRSRRDLVSVSPRACANGYNKRTVNSYKLHWEWFCAGDPEVVSLPNGVTAKPGTVSSSSQRNYSKTYSGQRTKAQIASALREPVADIITFTEDFSKVLIDHDEDHPTEVYPVGSSARNGKLNIVYDVTVYDRFLDDGSVTVLPGFTVEKDYNENGRYSEHVSMPPTITDVAVGPDPDSLRGLVEDILPANPVTYHAVVSAAGTDYRDLANSTGGVVRQLSQTPDSNLASEFVKELAAEIKLQPVAHQEVAKDFRGKTPVMVYNETTKKQLNLNVDYVLTKTGISLKNPRVGDKIRVKY